MLALPRENISARLPWLAAPALASFLFFLSERALTLALLGHVVVSPISAVTLYAGIFVFQLAWMIVISGPAFLCSLRSRRTPLHRRVTMLGAPLLAFALMAFPAYLTGKSLVSGPWISEQSWASTAAWAFTFFVPSALALSFLIHEAIPSPSPRRSARGITGVAFLLGLGSLAASILVMPGLHREAHLLLFVCGSAWIQLATIRSLVRSRGAGPAAPIAAAGVLALALPAWFLMSSQVRRELLLRSPSAANFIRSLLPPPPKSLLHDELGRIEHEGPPAQALGAQKRGLMLAPHDAPWNVLLIVVDTLRADTLPPVREPGQGPAEAGDTPFLDNWISNAHRFRYNYSQASRTNRSMPAMFRSIHANEHPKFHGQPLAETMSMLGRTPVAMVPNILFEERESRSRMLLRGFEHVATYDKPEMHTQLSRIDQVLRPLGTKPFFAWVHYYAMHLPGYNKRMLTKKDGPWAKRYRSSLQWLDSEIRRLFTLLDELKILDNTIVILAADHGEGLGANGVGTHGPTVFEEAVRTPLVISIPGYPGRVHGATVGNIDILPTILDLLGADIDPNHRGRSLVPTMANDDGPGRPPEKGERDYYIENADAKLISIVHGRSKLIFDKEAGALHRFDLKLDPREDVDLYGTDPEQDRQMTRRLLHLNPSFCADEYENPGTLERLRARLREQDPLAPSASLPFLLKTAAKSKDKQTLIEARRIFDETDDDQTRLLILRHLRRRDSSGWGRRIVEHLRTIEGTDRELRFIDGLAHQDQTHFDRRYAAARLVDWAEHGTPTQWLPWLRLVRKWHRLSASSFAAPLSTMLSRAQQQPHSQQSSDATALILTAIARLSRSVGKDLPNQIESLLQHEQMAVRMAATRALGRVGRLDQTRYLRTAIADHDLSMKKIGIQALVDRRGKAAIPVIVEAARNEELLSVIVVAELRRLKAEAGLPYLDEVAEDHYNRIVRKRAKVAAKLTRDRIEKRKAKRPVQKTATP